MIDFKLPNFIVKCRKDDIEYHFKTIHKQSAKNIAAIWREQFKGEAIIEPIKHSVN